MSAADSRPWRRMQKSLKSSEYGRLIDLLVAVRKKRGIRQQKLAESLSRPQSFIAKYENGERRIDLIEFITISRALEIDPLRLFKDFLEGEKARPKSRNVAKK